MRDVERREDLFIESVGALQQFLQAREEHARFGALDDAVVVRASDHHHFAEADHGPELFADSLVFRRVVDSPSGDNRALARHQARDRSQRPNGTWIGERNRGAFEIRDGQLAVAGAGHDIVISRYKLIERQPTRVLDVRNLERARSIFRNVDGKTDVYLTADGPQSFPVHLGVGVV